MKVSFREPGMVVSGVGHAAFLAAGLASLLFAQPFAPAEEGVPVEMMTASQFNEITRGERRAQPQPDPKPRVDRVAEVKQENDPGEAKRDVASEATPPPPRPEPRPTPPEPPRQEPPRQEAQAEPVRTAAPPPRPEPRPPEKPAEKPPEPEAEIIRQAAVTPPPPQPRPVPKPEAKLDPKPEPKDTKALQDILKKTAEEEKKAEEARKALEEKKKLEEQKRAEAKRRAEEKAKEQAEAKKLEDLIRQRLLVSKEQAQSSGATGAQVNRTASLGTPTASGRTLSPSDLSTIGAMIREQIERCWAVTGVPPSVKPVVRFELGPNGEIIGAPTLANSSPEPSFRSFAESGMRAIRQCAPYRIPARYADSYQSWRSITVRLNPDDFR